MRSAEEIATKLLLEVADSQFEVGDLDRAAELYAEARTFQVKPDWEQSHERAFSTT